MPLGTFLIGLKVQLDRIFILQNCSYYWETLTWLSWPLLQVFPWQEERCSQCEIGGTTNPNHRKSMFKLLRGSVFSMLPARSKHWPKHCSQNPPFVSWSIAPGAFSAQRVYLRNTIDCLCWICGKNEWSPKDYRTTKTTKNDSPEFSKHGVATMAGRPVLLRSCYATCLISSRYCSRRGIFED